MLETFNNKTPQIASTAFIHEAACLIGDVIIGEDSSIWPCAVLRADMGRICVGSETSIQDGTVIHLTLGLSETRVGNRVTVGHRVILHGCTVEDECLIGMGSILLDNCVIGKGSLIAAGTLITSGTVIPPYSLVMGSPGKVIRSVREQDQIMIESGWQTYVAYKNQFMQRTKPGIS